MFKLYTSMYVLTTEQSIQVVVCGKLCQNLYFVINIFYSLCLFKLTFLIAYVHVVVKHNFLSHNILFCLKIKQQGSYIELYRGYMLSYVPLSSG